MFSSEWRTEESPILNGILLKMRRFMCTQSTSSSPNLKGVQTPLAATLPTPIPGNPEGKIHKPCSGLWDFPWTWCYPLILMPLLTVCSCLCLNIPQLVCPSPQGPWSPSFPGASHGTLLQTQRHNTSSSPRSWIDSLVKTSMPGALSATGCSRWQEVKTLCLVEDVQQMLWPEDFRFSFLKEQSYTTTFTNSSSYNCITPASIQKLCQEALHVATLPY